MTLAPGWPDDPADRRGGPRRTRRPSRARASARSPTTTPRSIGGLDRRPVVIGHSFGGLITQKLAGPGLARAAVAIDPAPFRGVLPLPVSALRSSSAVLANPANAPLGDAEREAVPLRVRQRRAAGRVRALYDATRCPGPDARCSRPRRPTSPRTEASVDTLTRRRGPLLIISGEKDHTVPWAIANASYKKQARNPHPTEITRSPAAATRWSSTTAGRRWPTRRSASWPRTVSPPPDPEQTGHRAPVRRPSWLPAPRRRRCADSVQRCGSACPPARRRRARRSRARARRPVPELPHVTRWQPSRAGARPGRQAARPSSEIERRGTGATRAVQVVDAQYGGLLTDTASVLVVPRSWRRARRSCRRRRDVRRPGEPSLVGLARHAVHPSRPGPACAPLARGRNGRPRSDRIGLPPAARADLRRGRCTRASWWRCSRVARSTAEISVLRSGHPALRLRHRPAQRPFRRSGLRHLARRRACGRRARTSRASRGPLHALGLPTRAPTTSAVRSCSVLRRSGSATTPTTTTCTPVSPPARSGCGPARSPGRTAPAADRHRVHRAADVHREGPGRDPVARRHAGRVGDVARPTQAPTRLAPGGAGHLADRHAVAEHQLAAPEHRRRGRPPRTTPAGAAGPRASRPGAPTARAAEEVAVGASAQSRRPARPRPGA